MGLNNDLSSIKVSVNNSLILPLENKKANSLLIFGNTINFFGRLDNDGNLALNEMNNNDRNHFFWLVKRLQQKTKVYIIGEAEEKEYYERLFKTLYNKFKLKVYYKFLETTNDNPKGYLTYMKQFNNMKFDYIVGNPPYDDGIAKGAVKNLHLECVKLCLNSFNKKMIIVMPIKFIQNDGEKVEKYKKPFDESLISVTEYDSSIFEGTGMPNVAVYLFDRNKKTTDTIKINYLEGTTTIVNSLLDNKYDETTTKILSYLETDKDFMNWLYLGADKNNLKYCYEKQINKKLFNLKRFKNIIHTTNPSYVICNAANGGMTGTYFTDNTNIICEGTDNLINSLITRGGGVATLLYFNSLKAAINCKNAMNRPLLRFTCFISQIDQNMKGRVYKYIPNIDWEDSRCLTDEGLLEMCGCPSDKAKEYAEYVKDYVETQDKEIESIKKGKKK